MTTLFRKLRERDLELGRLKEEEEGERKHNVALKTVAKAMDNLRKIMIMKCQI